jgi:predicted RNA-binding Zn-ribbon protein involved in translation (DUF1610 family)
VEDPIKQCETCGGSLLPNRRSLIEKLLYVSVYKCTFCEARMARARQFTFWFARRSNCPKCGNERLDRLLPRARMGRLYHKPLVLAQSVLRAKLYHCPVCDLQFYRPRKGMAEILKSTPSWAD